MFEPWMLSLGIAIGGGVSTYAVLRSRVTLLEKNLEKQVEDNQALHNKETTHHDLIHKEMLSKMEATFKKYDTLSEKIIILQRDTSTHLDMQKAEERFVSKLELALSLENITITTNHTDKAVESLDAKMEHLTNAVFQVLHSTDKEK